MPAPIYDDEEPPAGRDRREEPSFAAWTLAGAALVLAYILACIVLLRT